jgi:hypothetical protein
MPSALIGLVWVMVYPPLGFASWRWARVAKGKCRAMEVVLERALMGASGEKI